MPRNELVVKRVPDLTDEEYRAVHSLNMGSLGMMRQALEDCRETRSGKAVIYYDDNESIPGWGLIFRGLNYYASPSSECLYVFVDPNFRRSGIGDKIVLESRKHTRYRPIVFPWDDRSQKFYIRLNNSVRLNEAYIY